MAEGSKVRLVRCPKCENLLPELPGYSVYQCGGCGAVLRAKKKAPASDGLVEKYNQERGKGGSEKLENLSERGGGSLSSASGAERESVGVERGRKRERIFGEASSSQPRTEHRQFATDNGSNMRGARFHGSSTDSEVDYAEKHRRTLKNPIDIDINMNRFELANSSVEKEIGETKPQIGHATGTLRSRLITDWWGAERDSLGAFCSDSGVVTQQGGFPSFPYSDEGPSNYHPGSSYGCGERIMNWDMVCPNRVENLEQDRAELLRKLDELKDQLSRSCDVTEKPRERDPVDPMKVPEDPSILNRVSAQPFVPDNYVPKPPSWTCSHGPVSYMDHCNVDRQNFYAPPRHAVNEIPGYVDPFQPQMPRKPSHQPSLRYLQPPSHGYCSGQCIKFCQVASYPREMIFHQPACSCLGCCKKNWQVPPQVMPTVFGNGRFPSYPTNPIYDHDVNPVKFGLQGHNPRGAKPHPLHSQCQHSHTRTVSDLDSDISTYYQCCLKRVVVGQGNGQFCHPIAGGAPFITCHKCLKLLKLPRKLLLVEKNQQKLQCGACYTVMLFAVKNKRIAISVPTQATQISAEVDYGSGEVLYDNILRTQGCPNGGSPNSCSDDYDESGYNFRLMDTEPNSLSKDQRLNSSESEKKQGLPSSSSSSSKDEESPDSVIVARDVSNSADMLLKNHLSPLLPCSPRCEQPGFFSSHHALSRSGKGNKSKHTDQEKLTFNKSNSRQNSVKDALVATELEISFNQYLDTSLTQDSLEVTKEDRPRVNKWSGSFFLGLIKKSFRDLSRSNQSVKNKIPSVCVNGHAIPDHLVKKAEKLAGLIQPGEYWYDFRAGFWGVMGQPCLGIIPPFIEEFYHPMPENCAAGNTGVFVNGRELHQKDLDLLASRGLPTTRDKSYIIEISGSVLDEDSGAELDDLGKLAPTVESVKQGFGMQVL